MNTNALSKDNKAIDAIVRAAGRVRAGNLEQALLTLEAAGWKRPDSCNNPQLRDKAQN